MQKNCLLLCWLLVGCVVRIPGVEVPDLLLADLVPPPDRVAHLDDNFLMMGTCDLTITADTSIDTGDLANTPPLPTGCSFSIAMETGSNGQPFEVVVLTVRNLTVEVGTTLKILGTLPGGTATQSRPLAIVAADTIRIDGTIDASADLEVSGPGGLSVQSTGKQQTGRGGMGNSDSSRDQDTGGGGGGYGTPGAASPASILGGTVPTAGGMIYNDNTLTMSVEGGSKGGSAEVSSSAPNPCGLGGGGGGALQLTAGEQLIVSGQVLANGGGGLGGCPGPVGSSREGGGGGGGGGSGGGLYLEAPTVTVSGTLAANGGGGGSGAQRDIRGRDGQNGHPSGSPASGGLSIGGGSGRGGNGAAATAATTGSSADNTGGGGGGVGRIVIRSTTLNRTNPVISPPAVEVTY